MSTNRKPKRTVNLTKKVRAPGRAVQEPVGNDPPNFSLDLAAHDRKIDRQNQEQLLALRHIHRKLSALERKIDRYAGYFISYSDPDSPLSPDRAPGNKHQFQVDVDNNGVFSYTPRLPWHYRPGDQVRWMSTSGELTVLIDGYAEFPSPFDDRSGRAHEATSGNVDNELGGRRFKSKGGNGTRTWATRQVRVQNLFSEPERRLRRRVQAPPLLYDFTFEIARDGGKKTFVETVRGVGSMC